MTVAAALIWVGCQKQVNAPNDIVSYAASNPQAVERVMVVQDANTEALMKVPGVIGVGTSLDDNGQLCIRVLTNSTTQPESAEPALARIAPSIEGIPVVVEETGPITAFALTKTYRPVPIGVSVGNALECASGTIGCQVTKSGKTYILSNNHVLARENAAAIGERINQPGRYDGKPVCAQTGQVATLSDFVPISFSGNNTMDCAIAEYTAGTAYSCATPSGYYGYPTNNVVAPSVGLAIKKVGRTTSQTTGTISTINLTITVGYSTGNATFTGQFYTSSKFSKSGDSGSLVVTNSGNNPVGLLFAGNTAGNSVCSPIGPILQRFGVSICTQ
ncbi:hypothetical protein C3F09_10800 [candidate division GN15 bacterium]|uniref:Serine protease n=1 Tax=candidate division GN15 bacterium TaxID=2072418 RepID=A0A855WWB3_9BACT|nr:MAG: hypothetical protein C3F09_10800 [candidate division GN15 bacterium]